MHMRKSFEKKALAHLKEKFSKQLHDGTDEQILIWIRAGISKASAYRIEIRRDVLLFLEYWVLLGERFDINEKYDFINKTLKIRNLHGTEKMRRIQQRSPVENLMY